MHIYFSIHTYTKIMIRLSMDLVNCVIIRDEEETTTNASNEIQVDNKDLRNMLYSVCSKRRFLLGLP